MRSGRATDDCVLVLTGVEAVSRRSAPSGFGTDTGRSRAGLGRATVIDGAILRPRQFLRSDCQQIHTQPIERNASAMSARLSERTRRRRN